jgi:hypothetical protein
VIKSRCAACRGLCCSQRTRTHEPSVDAAAADDGGAELLLLLLHAPPSDKSMAAAETLRFVTATGIEPLVFINPVAGGGTSYSGCEF